jgi:hypothetical protein
MDKTMTRTYTKPEVLEIIATKNLFRYDSFLLADGAPYKPYENNIGANQECLDLILRAVDTVEKFPELFNDSDPIYLDRRRIHFEQAIESKQSSRPGTTH